jgi:hypothetical protein
MRPDTLICIELRDFTRYGMPYTSNWKVVTSERVVSESYLSKIYAAFNPKIFPADNLGE